MVAASKVEGHRPTASSIVAEGYKDQNSKEHLDHANGPSSTNHGRTTNTSSVASTPLSSPLPVNFLHCGRAECTMDSPCQPVDQMSTSERRKHLYWRLKQSDFRVQQIVQAPIFSMSMNNSQQHPITDVGRVCSKYRYGMVVYNCSTHMVLLVFESAGGCGPLYKPTEKQLDCFGIGIDGTPYRCHTKSNDGALLHQVPFMPGQGVFYMPLDHAFKPKVGTYGDFSYVVSVPHDTRVKDFGMMPSELGDEIMRCYLERGMRETSKGLPSSIFKGTLQAAIKNIEEEEARKTQDFQDAEAKRMRQEVEDKARRQDTPHNGRVSQSQAGQPLARRDENANFSRGKKRGPGSDITMRSQYTKRAKTNRSARMDYQNQGPPQSERRCTDSYVPSGPSGWDGAYSSRSRGPRSERYHGQNNTDCRGRDSYRPNGHGYDGTRRS